MESYNTIKQIVKYLIFCEGLFLVVINQFIFVYTVFAIPWSMTKKKTKYNIDNKES